MGATGGERRWWAGRLRRLATQAPAPHLASGGSVIVPEKSSLGFNYSAKNFHSAPLQGSAEKGVVYPPIQSQRRCPSFTGTAEGPPQTEERAQMSPLASPPGLAMNELCSVAAFPSRTVLEHDGLPSFLQSSVRSHVCTHTCARVHTYSCKLPFIYVDMCGSTYICSTSHTHLQTHKHVHANTCN